MQLIHASFPAARAVFRAAAAAVAVIASAAPLRAQASQTAGTISGRVVDATAGMPLDAASLTAVNVETGLTRSALSGADGVYALRMLPPGTYRVSVRRIGRAPAARDSVGVSLGSTTTQNFALAEPTVTLAAVNVNAEAAHVDVTQGGVRQNVSAAEIQNLPTLGRDFTDFINLSGLVSPTPETTTGGQFSIAGARPSQTNLQLDGVDANNSFFGENRGGSRIPFNFSMESVKEFQIITNAFDVEYGSYAGGVVNIVSKGGTNRVRSSVYGNYRGDAVTAKNFDNTKPTNFQVEQFAAQTEGPMVKDKLFYFFSLDGQRRRQPFVPVSPNTLRGNGTHTDSVTADSLERFFSILQDKYGVASPGGGYDQFSTTNDVITFFSRGDWNIDDHNQFSLKDNYSGYHNLNETFSAVTTGGVSKAENFKNFTNSVVADLNSAVNNRTANVFRVQYSAESRPRVGNNLLPELRVSNVANNQAFAFGGASISFDNELDENKWQLVNNTTIDAGHHTFKFGTNDLFTHYQNWFWNNGSGFYTFDNLAAFAAMQPSRYTRSVQADGNAPYAAFGTQEYSAYAQDAWRITPKLLATTGVRYDLSRFGKRPERVIDIERAFGIKTGIAPDDNNNVSPRLSLVYDVNGDATQVVRAGAGLFYGRVPAVLGGNVAGSEIAFLSLDCSGSTANNDPTAPPPVTGYTTWSKDGTQNPMNCAGASGAGGTPTYSFWNSNFELPETFRANVGYERVLSRATRLSIDYLLTTTTKLYTVRDINLRPAQFTLADEGNRQVFVPQTVFSPASAAGADRELNTNFSNVFVNYNDGQARSQAVSINLDHTVSASTSLRASYTYTAAFDNGSFSCCTSFEGFSSTRVGAEGPNVIGGAGDVAAGWGPSAFVRNHTFIVSGYTKLPYGFRLSGVWRLQSGTPWGPEQGGDLNGDGVSFNDRPYIFKPEDLPVSVPASVKADSVTAYVQQQRDRYAGYLSANKCIAKYEGQIIPRDTCRQPWFNRLDLSLRNKIPTSHGQSVEISLDLFNVLNGLNKNWGRYESVQAANRDLVTPASYDAVNNKILYTVPTGFGQAKTLGTNLLLQFSAQLGLRYSF